MSGGTTAIQDEVIQYSARGSRSSITLTPESRRRLVIMKEQEAETKKEMKQFREQNVKADDSPSMLANGRNSASRASTSGSVHRSNTATSFDPQLGENEDWEARKHSDHEAVLKIWHTECPFTGTKDELDTFKSFIVPPT